MAKKQETNGVAAAVLGIALLAGMGSAQAAVVVGRWDPLFGSAFPGMGWEGEAKWFVPNACLPQPGSVTLLNSAACSGGGMYMIGATVNFYDYGADPTGLTSFKAGLAFGTQSIVNSVDVSGFSVANVVTNLSGAGTLSGNAAYDNVGAYNWAIRFTRGEARLYYAKIGDGVDDEWEYEQEEREYEHYDACKLGDISAPNCGVNNFSQFPAMVSFTTLLVPEPQTYALMLAGLAAVGFASLRRRRT